MNSMLTMTSNRMVATNERGMRIGQYHQRSKHPDSVVDRARELHEDVGLGYTRIARILGVSKSVVREWCRYGQRAQTYVGWKKVPAAQVHIPSVTGDILRV